MYTYNPEGKYQSVIMLQGLPASGKSSWSLQFLMEHSNWYRINRDSIREMYCFNLRGKRTEKEIISARNSLLIDLLNQHKSVIIDDTNLANFHYKEISKIIANINATRGSEEQINLEINNDFLDLTLHELIIRDKFREKSVGEVAIREMHKRYQSLFKSAVSHSQGFSPLPAPGNQLISEGLPRALIVDLDGTLALHNGRSPYDSSQCLTDIVNTKLRELIKDYIKGSSLPITIFFITGREDLHKEKTEEWLEREVKSYFRRDNLFPLKDTNYILLMRKDKDLRSDHIIKEELYNQYLKDQYNIIAVFEDRLRVSKMWHKLGLPLYRVGDPLASY